MNTLFSHPWSRTRRTMLAWAACASFITFPIQAETLWLTGGTVHPATSPALTAHNVQIVDGKIAAIVPATTPIPSDPESRIIDLSGLNLYPGLIAPGTPLGLIEIESIRATRDTTDVGTFTPEVFSWVAVNPDSALIPVARANGFTHAQPIPQGGLVSGHSSVIQLDGWSVEEMAVRRAAALHIRWPSFRLNTAPRQGGGGGPSVEDQIRSRERQVREIDRFFDQAEAYSKARKAAGLNTTSPTLFPQITESQSSNPPHPFVIVPAWESLLPVLNRDIPVFLHAEDTAQIRSAVEWAVRRKYNAVIVGARDAWRIADFLAEHKIPVIYENTFTSPARDVDPYDVHFAAPGVLAKAGVQVTFGEGTARFGGANVRNIPYAAAQCVAFGLDPIEALRGMTLYPAHILGLADQIGSIEVGRQASLIAVEGDILDIRSQVRHMWIDGRPVSLESRHTQLYERYRNRPLPSQD